MTVQIIQVGTQGPPGTVGTLEGRDETPLAQTARLRVLGAKASVSGGVSVIDTGLLAAAEYGGTGDGTTDDTAALLAAQVAGAAMSPAKKVWLHPGVWRIASTFAPAFDCVLAPGAVLLVDTITLTLGAAPETSTEHLTTTNGGVILFNAGAVHRLASCRSAKVSIPIATKTLMNLNGLQTTIKVSKLAAVDEYVVVGIRVFLSPQDKTAQAIFDDLVIGIVVRSDGGNHVELSDGAGTISVPILGEPTLALIGGASGYLYHATVSTSSDDFTLHVTPTHAKALYGKIQLWVSEPMEIE